MADIFISYKREDKKKAEMLAGKLETSGWKVWWDHDLLGGDDYDVVIARELSTTKCVIVIWSGLSVQSRNVKDEAKYGLNRNILIPVSFDGTEPPIGFGMTHTLNFENSQRIKPEDFARLCESVINKAGQPGNNPGPVPETKRSSVWIIMGVLIIILVIFFILFKFNNGSTSVTDKEKLQPDTAMPVTTIVPETNVPDPKTANPQTEREKIEAYFSSQGSALEASHLIDTILYFRVKQITQNSITVEVDYMFDSQHGDVYLGGRLWQFGKETGIGGYQPVLLSTIAGTAELTITIPDIKSQISSEGLLLFLKEPYKGPFHAGVFDFKHVWQPATASFGAK